MIALRVRKYKGANILIINEFQSFIAIIFYKGQFYHAKIDAPKMLRGKKKEYTNAEFAEACDVIYREAKKIVDAVRIKRSLITKLKILFNHYVKRQKSSLPQESGPERGERSSG